MKKVQSYVKNLGNSIKYAAIDVVKEMNPHIGEVIDTNSELFKEISYVVRDRKTMVSRVSRLMKSSKVYEAGDEMITSVFEDIASGNLYNRERKSKFEARALGMEDLISGVDFEIDEDFGDFDDFDISDGDEFIADVVDSSAKASASMISSSIARSSEYIVQSQRSMYEHSMMHNSLLFGNMNSMLSAINNNISNVVVFNDKAQRIHIENSKKYYEETTNLLRENTALLKELVEMDRNRYNKELKDQKSTGSTPIRYEDIVSASGIPDLKQYFKNVGRNINNELSSFTGMTDMFEGNALLALVGSPLEFIPKMLVSKMIDNKFKSSLSRLDKSISGFFSSLITRFNSMANDDDNFITSTLGKLLGVRNDLDLKIDNSKYNRNAIPWDGEAKKALTEVIPGYLSRLVAIQSGQVETVFNYTTGRYQTMDEIKKEYSNMVSSSVKSSTFEIRNAMDDMLKQFAFKDKSTKDNMTKDLDAFFEYFFKSGKLFDHNRKDYYDYEGLYLSSEDNYKLIEAMFKNLPRHMQLSMSREIMSGRSSLQSKLRNEEERGSIYSYLNDGYHEKYNNVKRPKYSDDKNPSSDSNQDLSKTLYSNNQKEWFNKRESERANKYNLRYIEDIIGNEDVLMRYNIQNELENKEIVDMLKDNNKIKNNKLGKFVEDLIGSSLSDKFKIVSGKIQTVTDSPWNFLTGMVDRIDLRLYEIIYGKDEREYRGENVKGLLDMMMVDLRNTFDSFNLWLDEKILSPLSERVKTFGTNTIDGFFSMIGLDITTKDMKDRLAEFIFGTKDFETGARSGGVLSNLSNQIKSDLNSIKTKVFGPNAGIMRIVKILAKYANDPTMNNLTDQLAILSEIETIVDNGFNPKTEKEMSLKRDLKYILNNINRSNPANSILDIGLAIDASGLDTYSKSVMGILKSNFTKTKDYVFGESKNAADKIQMELYHRAMTSNRFNNSTIDKIDPDKLNSIVSKIVEFNNTGDYSDGTKRLLLNSIVKEANKISISNKAEAALLHSISKHASNSFNITSSLTSIIQELIKHVHPMNTAILTLVNNKIKNNSNNEVKPSFISQPVPKFTPSKFIIDSLSNNNLFKDGEEDGSHSTGLASVPYDNYKAILHKKERVLTEEENKNLIQLFINDIKDIKEKIYDSDSTIGNIRSIINDDSPKNKLDGKFKSRIIEILDTFTGNNVDEVLDQILEESNKNIESRGSHTRESLLSKVIGEFRSMITSTKRALYGGDGEPENIEKDKDKFLEAALNDFRINFKGYLPKIGSGALIGGGIGLIPGLIGGPMMWASIGAATSLVNNSEDLQNYLFGEKDNDGKRTGGKLLSKKAIDAIDRYAPDMKKYGITGAALTLTPLLPGGPIAGLMMGSAVAFAKNNAEVQDFLFGEDGLIGPKAKEKVERILPKAILGTVATGVGGAVITGSAFGPFGLLGGAAIGTTMALVSDTNKFREAIFGKEDEKGVMQGGLVPTIRDITITPLKEGASKLKDSIKSFADDNIKKPFFDALEPFKKEIKLIAHSMKDAIKNSINAVFEKSFGEPLGDLVKNHIVEPFKNLFKRIFSSIGKLLGSIASTPFKAMSYAGNELRIKHMKSGDADYMTPEQQDEMIKKHPFRFLFGSKTFSRAFAYLMGFGGELDDEYTDDVNKSNTKNGPIDPIDEAIEGAGLNKPSFIKKMNDKILEKYNNMSSSYKALKDSISSKLEDGKNKFLNRVQLAAKAGMTRESETSSSSDDEPASSSYTDKSTNNKTLDSFNKLLKDRDDKIKNLQDEITKLSERHKSKYNKDFDNDEDYKDSPISKDLSVIKNHVIIISNEVAGQLDGVGYNLETIKNILVDNLGEPESEATGLGTSRGNKSRRGILGRIFDFLKNPTQKLKGFMTNIFFGKDGEGGMFGWINKGLRAAKEILLAPLKIVQEVFGVIKGIGSILTEAVKAVGPAVAEAIKGSIQLISAPFIAVSKVIVGFGEGLANATSHVVEGLGVVAGSLIEFTSVIPKAISLIGEFSVALTDGIFNITKGITKFIGGMAKFGISALFKDKVQVENVVSMKLEGGYLDSIKTVETVKVIEKINNIPTSNIKSSDSDGMYTRFGKIKFRKDYKGNEVPIKDMVYMKNQQEELSDNQTMNDIKDLMKENVDQSKDISKSVGFMDKIKGTFGGFFNGFSSLKPLLFLALPFLPQIATGLRNILEHLGIGTKEMIETGVKTTAAVSKWAWDKSHEVLDNPERSVYNYATQRALPNFIARESAKAASKASKVKTASVIWDSVKKTSIGGKLDDITKPVLQKASVLAPKNIMKSIITKIDDLFSSKAVRKVIGDKIADAMQGFGKAILSKVDDGIILAIGKKVQNFIPILNYALFAADIGTGMGEAENILKVDGKVPFNVRVMAGIIKAVNQFLFFGLIPTKTILDTLMNLIPAFDDERELINESQKALVAKYNKYKKENPGTRVTFDDFNDSQNWKFSEMTKYGKDPQKIYDKKSNKAYNKKGSNSSRTSLSEIRRRAYGKGSFTTDNYLFGTGFSDIMVNDGSKSQNSGKKESNTFPFYSQKDPKWDKKSYNIAGESVRQNIGNSGCGPTAAAMVISGLTSETVTPDKAADYALRNKYKEYNGGTLPEFFSSFAKEYGLETSINELDGSSNSSEASNILSRLKQNKPVILMGRTDTPTTKTPFGKNPHYVVATGIDSKNNIIIHNPEEKSGGKKFNLNDTIKNTQLGIISELSKNMSNNIILGEDGQEPELSLWDRWKGLTSSIKDRITDVLTGGTVSNNEFIQKVIPGAMKSYQRYGILPSITIAQAILESGFGKKSIDNNIFGIKATSSWKGKTKTVWTTEYRNGRAYKERHAFRAYDSIDESILDHGKLIGTAKRYDKVRTAKNYKEAAYAIYKAGYATDPKYPSKLINLIEKHRLYALDSGNSSALNNYIGTTSSLPTKVSFTKNYSGSKGKVTGQVNMHDWFIDRFRKISEDYGNSKVTITSGYRSKADQTRLWNQRKAKYPNETDAQRRRWVADPNSGSLHQHGVAADVAKGWIRNLSANKLAEYGLWRPLSNEPWHFEPIETGYPSLSNRNSNINKLRSGIFGVPGKPKYTPPGYKKSSSNNIIKNMMSVFGKGSNISNTSNMITGLGSSDIAPLSFKPEDLSSNRYNDIKSNARPSTVKTISQRSTIQVNSSNQSANNSIINSSIIAILIKLLTNIVENTNNLSEVVRLLSEGLNINIPESKLNKIKSTENTTTIIPAIATLLSDTVSKDNNYDNTDTVNLINMLNAIAAQ